jgi:hypothetical protein
LPFLVGVFLFSLPPLRSVGDLGQNQRRLDRIEHLAEIQILKQRITATVVDIDEIFTGTPLRRDPRRKIRSGTGEGGNFDLGISFLEHAGIDNRAVAADRHRELALLLGRAHRLLPFGLPGSFGFGAVRSIN